MVVRNNILKKGPNSDNNDMIGIAHEMHRLQLKIHSTVIEGNIIIFDRWRGRLLTGKSPGPIMMRDNTVIGMGRGIGVKVVDQGGNKFIEDRAKAGLSPFPALPVPSQDPRR